MSALIGKVKIEYIIKIKDADSECTGYMTVIIDILFNPRPLCVPGQLVQPVTSGIISHNATLLKIQTCPLPIADV
jgi:hypothetical protein